nr:MAG TPA: hypothetical protein [Caudoviricetes sp.]
MSSFCFLVHIDNRNAPNNSGVQIIGGTSKNIFDERFFLNQKIKFAHGIPSAKKMINSIGKIIAQVFMTSFVFTHLLFEKTIAAGAEAAGVR